MREARENSCCDKEAADAAAAEVDAAWTARRISLTREDRMARAAADAAADAAIAAAPGFGRRRRADGSGEPGLRNQRPCPGRRDGAWRRLVRGLHQGLPVALEKVLGNESLAKKLQQQSAPQIVNTLLTNYTLSFDRTAAKLRGDNPDEEKWEFLGMDTAFATLLISCLVMVMMALVMFRMERHLRGIGAQSGQKS
jgi:hypothetical protein